MAADNVLFGVDGNYDVILGANSAANNMTFSAGTIQFIDAGGSMLSSGGVLLIDDPLAASLAAGPTVILRGPTWDNVGDALVADAGYGSLTLNSGGSLRGEDIVVGNQVGSVGVVHVDGVGSLLQTDGPNASNGFLIGNAGTGTLNVTGGGRAETVGWTTPNGIPDFRLGVTAGGVGTMNIAGAGSQAIAEDLFVGNFGTGHLNITAGGVLNQNIYTSPDAFVAQGAGSNGHVTVRGDGSQWRMARLEIGNLGDATLSVEEGGFVRSNSNDVVLGDAGGSGRAAVFGSGASNSRLEIANDLYVGSAGSGVLRIGQDLAGTANGNGALQVGSDLFIGHNAGNDFDNKVIVDGVGATVNVAGALDAGRSGRGTLEVLGGATVTVGSWLGVGLLSGGRGTVLLDGPGTSLTARGLFAGNGSGSGSTGSVTVSGGAVATLTGAIDAGADAVTLGDDGQGVGTLSVTGAGSRVETTNATGGWFIGGSQNEPGGTGTANILDGGRGVSASRVVIGHGTGALGTLNVEGPNSQFDANGDYILTGFTGVGNLVVNNGGVVNANRMFVADATGSAGSRLEIDGVGSVVNLTRHLHVGDSARGTVNVINGGQLNVATSNLAERLIIGDESGTDGSRLTVTGAGSRVDYFGTDRVSVGFAGGGSLADPVILEVRDGAVLEMEHANVNMSIGLFVGDEPNSAGLVTVDGAGSQLHTSRMYVSDSTNTRGTVNIAQGGAIEVDLFVEIGSAGDGDGFLTVSGAGSRLEAGGDLSVAAGSSTVRVDGTLNVTDGGVVMTGDQGFIGRASTNVGSANVGGAGAPASWEVVNDLFIAGNESLSVGGSQASGSGTLNLEVNGRVAVGGTLVLKDRGTMNLNGGEVAANDFLFQDFTERPLSPTVNFHSGTFRYTNASGKTIDAATLGTILGGSGTLASNQHLAVDGLAVLNTPLRVNGGALSVGTISTASLANVDFDAGTLNFTNSNLVITPTGLFGGTLVVDENQTINVANQLNIADSGLVSIARGTMSADNAVNFGTTIVAEGTVSVATDFVNNGDLVLVDGTIHGNVNNNGDLTVVNPSVLGALALNGTGSVQFGLDVPAGTGDLLAVTGAAQLGGSLNVIASDLAGIALGQQFDLITAATIQGVFATENLPTLGGNLGLELLYAPTRVALRVIDLSGPTGDFNGDGNYDCLDVDSLVAVLAAGANSPAFDLNGDGMVTGSDLESWLAIGGANHNPSGNPYLFGDANLDGFVDGSDFNIWNANKFTSTAAWCSGDFTADGFVDGSDFNVWNAHKFTSSGGTSVIPEPAGMNMMLLAALAALRGRHKRETDC